MQNRSIASIVRALLVLGIAGGLSLACLAASSAPHWAFERIRHVPIPSHGNAARVTNPIDAFIAAGLESRGLKPAKPAPREILLRRVYFDLIGLPPTPAEVDSFLADRADDAWEKVIEHLLDSPHYGERWARHWLDVVRYAESDGFEHDAVRPNSWRYRDWVIDSFNRDKPYSRFVQEQIAGDELWPGDPAAVIATAFNLLGPDMVDSADQTQRRLLTLSDMTDTTAVAFLGLTMGCARCHDHKSEPITQADYYGLQAHFAPAEFHRDLAVPTAAERKVHESAMADYNQRTKELRRELEALERPYRESLLDEKLGRMSEDVQLAHRTPKAQRTAEQESSVLETLPQLQITESELSKAIRAADRRLRADLQARLKRSPKPAPLPQTLALKNGRGPVPATHVLRRGDYNSPAERVTPTIPAVLGRLAGVESDSDSRRGRLAAWMASRENPLTARVMVNRIWQHHFGRGLVATPNDFGTQGARPTHPELLDWLAGEFINRGWSIKAMHRLILRSATYQQSSIPSRKALAADPENERLSHQNRLRLEGEVLRDSLLLISGQLNVTMGGPSVLPPIPADIIKTSKNWTPSADPADHHRRSIYIFARRNLRFPFLEVFDAPDSNLSCPERGQSTTAPQSLTLLNSVETVAAARHTALQLTLRETSENHRIESAFRMILGRKPDRSEMRISRKFLQATRQRFEQGPAAASSIQVNEWTELCRALFNLNDFVYVD